MNLLNFVRRNPVVFPLACLVAVALVLISEGSYWRAIDTMDDLGATGAARTSIRDLHLGLVEAETGQRGYLLTNRKQYLRPYTESIQHIKLSLDALDKYYAGNAQTAVMMVRLRALTQSKLAELDQTVVLREQGEVEAAKQIVQSDLGLRQMDAIRLLSTQMLNSETQRVQIGRQALYKTLSISRIGLAALSAISLLAMFLYLRQAHALRLQQQELKRNVQFERDRLEVDVRNRTAQLSALTQHLLTAREDERARLARNLHDELGALLTAAKLDAARIKSRLAGAAPEALERLAHLVETLNASIALGRRIIEDLRPSTLSNLGLVATLEILAREFADSSGIVVHNDLAPVRLEPKVELVIYRLVQEAITNISKYAQASQVWLGLSAHGGVVFVSVRDNGVGFDTSVQPASTYGLVGMRFKVEAEGGTLALTSAPGQGTLIQVTLPESSLPPPPSLVDVR